MKELLKKTPQELTKMIREKEESLRLFRFAISGSKTRNVREGRMLRREIAQIHTALGQSSNAHN
jgi:ribosomal protein L29